MLIPCESSTGNDVVFLGVVIFDILSISYIDWFVIDERRLFPRSRIKRLPAEISGNRDLRWSIIVVFTFIVSIL